jgi:serine/threonine protein kinase/tetratricopeptide (TPR) repeat protein
MNEESIFLEALRHEAPEERAAFLARACAGDEALRRSVELLLEAHARAGDFLKAPPPEGGRTVEKSFAERPGTQVGPYKLLEAIGEGGMGTVWMAQQQEPVRRLVAVKVLKPGMDSDQVIARFEAERQALALMDHPSIAKVLDGGTTEAGRPYFVMELVKGVAITQFCDEHRLGPRQRLELMAGVCQAVQHAHQKGVIHRDLKPSNVLVALYDDRPVPKVIDFGVAKATGPQLTERTLFTGFGAVVGTLEYMSPEQAGFNQLDVDTRSDVYSLGVLLYELLTGSTPLERRRCQGSVLDVLRAVREEEPPRPSARLSTTEELPAIAASRGLEPKKLCGLVRGELDWIVMKALEKDRNRRYESAGAFAADVHRYLHDEPVFACPPSAAYRFRKLARRHKVALGSAGLVAAALLLGTVVSCFFAWRAGESARQARQEQERTAAEKERARKNLHGALEALGVLLEVDREQLAHEPHLEHVRAELMTKALAYFEKFLRDNADDPAMRREAGVAYRWAGDLHEHLGRYARAEEAYGQGVALLEQLADDSPGDPTARQALAHCLYNRSLLLERLGRLQEAERDVRRAAGLQEQLIAERPDRPDYRHDLAQTVNVLGLILKRSGRYDEAEKAYRRSLVLAERLPAEAKYQKSRVAHLDNLATLLKHTGRIDEAEKAYRESVRVAEQVLRRSPQDRAYRGSVAASRHNLGYLLKETGRPKEAEEELTLALKYSRQVLDDFPGVPRYRFQVANNQNSLASLWWKTARAAEAERLFAEASGLLRKLADEYPKAPGYAHTLGGTLHNLGVLLQKRNEHARARAAFEEAVACAEKALALSPRHPDYREMLGNHYLHLATALDETKAPAAEVERAFRRAADHSKKLAADFPSVPDHQARVGAVLNNWGGWLRVHGRHEEARTLLKEAIAWQEKAIAANPKSTRYREYLDNHYTEAFRAGAPQDEQALRKAADNQRALIALSDAPGWRSKAGAYLSDLAILLFERGEAAEARRLLEEAVAHQSKAVKAGPRNVTYRCFLRNHHGNLGKVLAHLGERGQAAKAFRQAVALGEGLVKDYPKGLAFERGQAAKAFRVSLAHDYLALGSLLDGEQAEENDRLALPHWQVMVDEQPGVAYYRSVLADLHHNRAVAHAQRGQPGKAVPLFQKAALHQRVAYRAEPEKYRGRLLGHCTALTQAHLQQKDHAAAAVVVAEMLEAAGKGWRPYYRAGQFLARCGGLAADDPRLAPARRRELDEQYTRRAWDALAEAARRDPEPADVQSTLADFLTTCPDPKYRDPARAVALARKAVKQGPNKRPYWAALGTAEYRAGNWDGAVAAIEKARQLGPSEDTLFFLAMAHWRRGEKKLAHQRYGEAVRWMERHAANDPFYRAFRDEAAGLLGLKKK